MTESEHKASLLISLFVIVLVFVSAFILFRSTRADIHKVKLGGEHFTTEIASTPMAREKGLSGRESLAHDRAMMFQFEISRNECFWMNDMKFNIDMIWLDTENRINAIERNVSPDTYPKNFCHEGKSVIELAAGTADRLNLKVGDQADL